MCRKDQGGETLAEEQVVFREKEEKHPGVGGGPHDSSITHSSDYSPQSQPSSNLRRVGTAFPRSSIFKSLSFQNSPLGEFPSILYAETECGGRVHVVCACELAHVCLCVRGAVSAS